MVDHFTKTAHFIPCTTTADAFKVAQLFFKEIACRHELPKKIVSNHDTRFELFWKTWLTTAKTKLNFAVAYHPQTNGQSEVVNRSIGQLLQCLVRDHITTCDQVLPMAEFTYNNSVNRSPSIHYMQW